MAYDKDLTSALGSLGGDLGGAGSALAILAGAAGEGGMGQYEDAINVLRQLQLPDFDMSSITPAQLQLVAEYFPQEYSAVIAQKPELIQDSPAMRQQQLQALAGMSEVGREGLGIADKIARDQAMQAIAQEQSRGQEAGLTDLAARGRLGGGQEMALRLGGGQQAMTAANTLGSNLVRDAQLQRLGALAQSGEMAGTIRGQDVDVSAQSADIMNRFNEWASQLSTMAARDNAQARQTAQGQNAANKQRVSEWNAINKQATQESNLERQNHLKELTFSNDLSRRGALVNAMNTLGGAKNAGSAATAANIRALGTGLGNIAGTGIGALGLL